MRTARDEIEVNRNHPTLPPPADEIEKASSSLDTATMALLNASAMAGAGSDDLEAAVIRALEDHGHAMLRAAEALRAGRIRRHARQGIADRMAKGQ